MTASKPGKWTTAHLLSEAATWADMLCSEACWHENRCSWIGHSPDESPQEGPLVSGVASLGPDLYSGTAGVALFLAQLNAIRPNSACRQTALGAIRHARRHADWIEASAGIGLHTGLLGIAFACGRVGRLLGLEDLVADSIQLARSAIATAGNRPLLDFISGAASAVCALLVMTHWGGGADLESGADALGRNILSRAITNGGKWSWSNSDMSGGTQWPRPLNGLAHGVAGVGIALLELYRHTNAAEYREAGLGAFAYEDEFLNEEHGNWDDLRVEPGAAPQQDDASRHTLAWCHGAPGIVLTRLRALQLVPDETAQLRRTITIGLGGTANRAESLMQGSAFDVTSCHGLAGLIEPFVVAAHTLGDVAHLQRAHALWSEAFRRRDEQATWMSGVGTGGKNPSLMLGIAGLGYGLLRAFDHERVPSLLLPTAS